MLYPYEAEGEIVSEHKVITHLEPVQAMFNAIESFCPWCQPSLQQREVRELGTFSPLYPADTWSALKIYLKLTEVTKGRDYCLPSQRTSCLRRVNIISNALWFMLNIAASLLLCVVVYTEPSIEIISFDQHNSRVRESVIIPNSQARKPEVRADNWLDGGGVMVFWDLSLGQVVSFYLTPQHLYLHDSQPAHIWRHPGSLSVALKSWKKFFEHFSK